MNKLTTIAHKKNSSYQVRKNRSNAKIKANRFENRLIFNKSNTSNYAMMIDIDGKVVFNLNDSDIKWNKTQKATELGKKVADLISSKKITFVFDRNWYAYKGRVKAFCESIREAGVKF